MGKPIALVKDFQLILISTEFNCQMVHKTFTLNHSTTSDCSKTKVYFARLVSAITYQQ